MLHLQFPHRSLIGWALCAALLLTNAQVVFAQDAKPRLDIYGFAMLDMGYQFKQNDPNWFDVLRPTKLPSVCNEFGEDGKWFSSVRQSRFGVKSFVPTDLGELRTIFEFEMFGVGVDAGQTTIRLRHAYGELGHFGAGQYWSPFMDIDVFPNSVEYWGPNGMVFFRNVQARWMPIQGDTRLTFALERPGASGDGGIYSEYPQLTDIKGRFPYPDVSAEYRWGQSWGYIEAAGIVRYIKWDDMGREAYDLSGDALGWGINLSAGVTVGEMDRLHAQVVYGEGVENYMNDATVDVGIKKLTGPPPTDPSAALDVAELLPVTGVVLFYDHYWNKEWSSTFGYSRLDIKNSDGQTDEAFKNGQYALVNLMHYPAKDVMIGAEFQYGRRENRAESKIVGNEGFKSVDDYRIQFSFKYNFSLSIGG
jgi:hypothetical protein